MFVAGRRGMVKGDPGHAATRFPRWQDGLDRHAHIDVERKLPSVQADGFVVAADVL